MSKVVLTDTCFWLGLVTKSDQHYESALAAAVFVEDATLLFPWPCMYETICTNLVRRRQDLLELEAKLKAANVTILDDSNYRDRATEAVFMTSREHGYSYSLADAVIREILMDINVKVDFLLTFNVSDFQDVCDRRSVEIIF